MSAAVWNRDQLINAINQLIPDWRRADFLDQHRRGSPPGEAGSRQQSARMAAPR
jgi:hypothetical protein